MINKPKTSDVNPKKGQNAQAYLVLTIGATLPVTFWYRSETQSPCRKILIVAVFCLILYVFRTL